MTKKPEPRYKLAQGSQVREEDFGLLFYTMAGPRLYFLSCAGLLDRYFFNGELTLEKWMRHNNRGRDAVSKALMLSLINSLHQLKEKGVIIEC
jgi:putative mycofactocin binding protein MftB